MLNLFVRLAVFLALASGQATAEELITKSMIMQVIEATDQASIKQDTATIGSYLASDFYKFVDVPTAKPPVTVRLDKQQYLELIEDGWQRIADYKYERIDLVVNVAKDGQIGESSSTIVETLTLDGKNMVSKVREYATYKLENGQPVIIMIDSHRLVGDSTLE